MFIEKLISYQLSGLGIGLALCPVWTADESATWFGYTARCTQSEWHNDRRDALK